MKRFVVVLLLMLTVAVTSFAAPVYTGADGYLTMPAVDVPKKGRVGLSFKYTSASTLTPAFNIVPLKNFEIGAGWDLDLNDSYVNPIMISLKYQFVSKAAIGFLTELALNAGAHNYYTLYLAWREKLQAGGLVDSTATFSFGYTFNRGSNINFYMGFQRNIFLPRLYLVGDVSNFPYRLEGTGRGSYLSDNRGIVNLGLRLMITKNISIDFAGMDLMDSDRQLMLGGNLYLKL